MNLLIKYVISGDFEEFESYNMKFDLTKMIPIYTVDQEPEKFWKILSSFHQKPISMTFRGLSKQDSMNLFVIDIDQNLRNLKLDEVLNFK